MLKGINERNQLERIHDRYRKFSMNIHNHLINHDPIKITGILKRRKKTLST